MFSKLHKELGAGLLAIVAVGALLRQMVNIEILEPRHENVQRGICLSNLKQIGFAVQMYAQDSSDILPRAATSSGGPNWMRAASPYLHDQQLFSCPANESGGFSYVWNDAYSAPKDGLSSPSGQSLSHIENPSETVLIADGTGNFRFKWELPQGNSVQIGDGDFQLGSIIGRHAHLPACPLFCRAMVMWRLTVFSKPSFRERKMENPTSPGCPSKMINRKGRAMRVRAAFSIRLTKSLKAVCRCGQRTQSVSDGHARQLPLTVPFAHARGTLAALANFF